MAFSWFSQTNNQLAGWAIFYQILDQIGGSSAPQIVGRIWTKDLREKYFFSPSVNISQKSQVSEISWNFLPVIACPTNSTQQKIICTLYWDTRIDLNSSVPSNTSGPASIVPEGKENSLKLLPIYVAVVFLALFIVSGLILAFFLWRKYQWQETDKINANKYELKKSEGEELKLLNEANLSSD